ncbi:MAG: hypothetical protein P1V33_04050 [Pseudohongiella nitratireducens]|nr:hypothetical protein [Pseudohongiella nitratireducens]MDF1622628.1 hypothetical protein [Pseudohongiella nitratireducens]
MLPPRLKKSHLSKLILTGLLSSLASSAFAGNFVLQNNQISWVSSGTSTNTSTATIASTGVADTINLLKGNDASALPKVSFTLEDLADTTGIYYIRLFMQIADQSNNNQLEMRLGVVEMAVDAGDITNAQIITNQADPNYAFVHVYAQKESDSTTLNLDAEFSTRADMVTGGGNDVTINMDNVISALSGNNSLFDGIIERFASTGTFDYIIGVKDDSINGGRIGTNDGGAFTVSPVAVPNFDLNADFDVDFAGATYIKGTLAIVNTLPTPPDTGGGSTTPDPVENVAVGQDEIDALDNQADELDSTVDEEINRGQISQTTITQTATATTTAQSQVNTVVSQLNNGSNVSTDNVINVLTTSTKVVSTGSRVVSAGSTGTAGLNTQTTQLVNASTEVIEQLANNATNGLTILAPGQQSEIQLSVNSLLTSTVDLTRVTQSVNDHINMADSVTRMINATSSLGIAQDVNQVNSVARGLQQNIARRVLGIDEAPDDNILKTMLQVTNQAKLLLDGTPDSSRVNQPSLSEVANQVKSRLQLTNPGLSGPSLDNMVNNLSRSSQLTQSITQQIPLNSILSSLAASTTGNASDGSGTADITTGNLSIGLQELIFSGRPTRLKQIPPGMTPGTFSEPNGDVTIFTADGAAVTISPAPANPVQFNTSVNNLGFVPNIKNGEVNVPIDNDARFSGAFTFEPVNVPTGFIPVATSVLIGPTGSPASPNSSYQINYPNGSSQRIQPSIADSNVFKSLDNLGLNPSADRNSGTMSVGGSTVRPDYFVQALNSTDRAFLDQNADASGVAYRQLDANGDGVTDYEVLSASGKQIVYGVP